MLKPLTLILSILLASSLGLAHPSFELHRQDFYAVLGLDASSKNAQVDEWMKEISSRMIDDYRGEPRPEFGGRDFYTYLKDEFPGFKCQHRYLFHWGYNARPWTETLEKQVLKTCPQASNPEVMERFKTEIRKEQQRRNRTANAKTEALFGFASGGKEAGYANALVSIIYDTHIIGDYTTDNRKISGLQEFQSVVGDLINAIRRIDAEEGKPIIKAIQKLTKETVELTPEQKAQRLKEEQILADNLMILLKKEMPIFLQKAQEGSFYKRIKKTTSHKKGH